MLEELHHGSLSGELHLDEEKRRSHPRVRGNGTASVKLASSSRHLPYYQHTGRNWLNVETLKPCESVRCHPARSSTDVCQRGTVSQCIGEGNSPCEVSPHPQGAWLALGLVQQGDGIHYPVGQPLLGDSLPLLLISVADKELLRAPKAQSAVHVYVQRSYGTQQCQVGSASSEGSACRFKT